MEIIPANQTHIPIIRDIAFRTWPKAYGNILSEKQISYMLDLFYSDKALNEQMQSGHFFILGMVDDIPIGFASYSINEIDKISRLHKLYVLTEYQGKNIGKHLLDEVIKQVTKNATILELNVNRENPAIQFYIKHQFKVKNSEDIDIGNGYYMNDYVMERNW